MPTKIEWCDETINPFWGCLHGCFYCAARQIAHMRAELVGRKRGYPPDIIQKMRSFKPVWLPDAERILGQCEKWKKPRAIFIGFMGDIYGDWVPRDWAKKVFDIAYRCPWHTFLTLTKSPINALGINYPENLWIGATITSGETATNSTYLKDVGTLNTFISFEPLLGDVRQNYIISDYVAVGFAAGVIVGALTKQGRPVPPDRGGTRLEWVLPIIDQCDTYDIPLFIKDNLYALYPQLPLRKDLPWRK